MPFIQQKQKEQGLDMLVFMLTNILTESTDLLCAGQGSEQMIAAAFHMEGIKENSGSVMLQSVVSRKKQLIPVIMMALQN